MRGSNALQGICCAEFKVRAEKPATSLVREVEVNEQGSTQSAADPCDVRRQNRFANAAFSTDKCNDERILKLGGLVIVLTDAFLNVLLQYYQDHA